MNSQSDVGTLTCVFVNNVFDCVICVVLEKCMNAIINDAFIVMVTLKLQAAIQGVRAPSS